MIYPFCGQSAQRYQISRRQQEKAKRPRPSIRGTDVARDRSRKASLVRWQRERQAAAARNSGVTKAIQLPALQSPGGLAVILIDTARRIS